jgi:thiosulfate dehydrogenase
MNPPLAAPSRAEERRQTRVLVTIVAVAVGLAVATVVGFNWRSSTLFSATYPVAESSKRLVKVRSHAPVPDTAPEPASAAEETQAPAAQGPGPALAQGGMSTDSTGQSLPPPPGAAAGFVPPAQDALPEGPMGEVVRRGEQIFLNTRANAPAFVGNALNCVNCHLDAGRKADAAPMWGAWPMYPAYRNKTRHVDTFAERLRGCFTYSMNGTPPPFGDEVLVALEAYAYWMSQGAPAGEKLPGAGYAKLPPPEKPADAVRGQAVFQAQCALCHGADGQGQRVGDVQVFPPLWGPQSYNWGAGMHKIDTAAAFIQANMPLGQGGRLSVQEAWDVARFINGHERPQDPRFTGDVAQTRARFHDTKQSLYGTQVNGRLLGSQSH